MSAHELAHWRYRIGAIERELASFREGKPLYLQVAGQLEKYTDPKTVEYRAWCLSIVDTLRTLIDANLYLLEEARYMAELEALT